jgi:hypothetical protein
MENNLKRNKMEKFIKEWGLSIVVYGGLIVFFVFLLFGILTI